ncbi:FkbM family methyltransferase [Roseibium sp. MMSF_3544]|uniref:FkbM family methyltransferase n=1 Tax=unclassified Roseibium TaxID=2629323 RepID=UPI00273DD1AA|nr:FkbM family methyltransferase [Roseibium sp. MMSF_3544]
MCEAQIDGRHGRFRFLRHDTWIGASLAKYGEFSELETAFLLRLCKPGHTVVEVGAHIGTQSVPLARHLTERGTLHVFEPQPRLFRLLEANLAQVKPSNVTIHNVAVGDSADALCLPETDYSTEGNFGGVALSTSTGGEQIAQVRLDDVLDPGALHLMKIDVEGMELAVLKGASGLISRYRPLMMIENDRSENSAELIGHLFDLDYRLMWSTPPLFNPDNFFGESENIFPGIFSVNMLCIPAERFGGEIGEDEITSRQDRPWP